MRLRIRDRHRNGRKSSAAAEVEHWSMRSELLSREQRLVDVRVEIAPRLGADEIDLRRPLEKETPVGVDPLLDTRRQLALSDALELFPRRCIRSTEIPAGVIPGIREAWPREAGRMDDSFSTSS